MTDHGPQKQPASVGPFGCWCEDLHHRAAGDGCEICNPMPDLYGDECDECESLAVVRSADVADPPHIHLFCQQHWREHCEFVGKKPTTKGRG